MNKDRQTNLKEFIESLKEAFEEKDVSKLQSFVFDGQCEKGAQNSLSYNEELTKKGYKINKADTEPYSQPKWEVFKDYEFYPEPEVSLALTLENEVGRKHELFYAIKPDADGRFKICYLRKK